MAKIMLSFVLLCGCVLRWICWRDFYFQQTLRPLFVTPHWDSELVLEKYFRLDKLSINPSKGDVQLSPLILVLISFIDMIQFPCYGWLSFPDHDLHFKWSIFLVLMDIGIALLIYHISNLTLILTNNVSNRIKMSSGFASSLYTGQIKACDAVPSNRSDHINSSVVSELFKKSLLVGSVYFLHPFTIIANSNGSIECIPRLFLLLSLWLGLYFPSSVPWKSCFLSGLSLGLAIHFDIYYSCFAPSLLLIHTSRQGSKQRLKLFVVFGIIGGILLSSLSAARYLGSFPFLANDFFDFNWTMVAAAELGGWQDYRPGLGLNWYLPAICFKRFRRYFAFLHSGLLPILISPIILRLAKLPCATWFNVLGGKRDHSKAIDAFYDDCGGGLVAFSISYALFALLHPTPSFSNFGISFVFLFLHPSLLFNSYHEHPACLDTDSSSAMTPDHHQKNSDSSRDDRLVRLRSEIRQSRLLHNYLLAVIAIGLAITTSGVVTVWGLWIRGGRGNANYLYFQSLAFHGFQSLLVCVFTTAAIRRQEFVVFGERNAHVVVQCALIRWLRRRKRRKQLNVPLDKVVDLM